MELQTFEPGLICPTKQGVIRYWRVAEVLCIEHVGDQLFLRRTSGPVDCWLDRAFTGSANRIVHQRPQPGGEEEVEQEDEEQFLGDGRPSRGQSSRLRCLKYQDHWPRITRRTAPVFSSTSTMRSPPRRFT